ncbi:MAG: MFS transporter [Candidatus Paceibacteria bacterium]
MAFYHHNTLERTLPNSIRYNFVYLLAIIFTFHSLVVAFSNSTYLEGFIDAKYVGLLFSLGSLGSILLFLTLPDIMRRFGNVLTTIITMAGAVTALLLMGFALSPLVVIISFVVFLALNPLGYFSIDVFSETLIGNDENDTGKKRGIVLALMSVAALSAPLMIGTIVGEADNLARLYFVAAGVGVLFIFVVVGIFRQFYDPVYQPLPLRSLYALMRENTSISVVIYNHFLLQLFFSWAIIYIPLYLATEIGLGWDTIGLIIAAGLLAFAIFEYPAGYIADKFIGEQEMMAVGFLILALTVAGIAMVAPLGVAGWMALMFINRTGASLVEATTESYFFKCVKGEDAGLMSIFRLLRPLAVLCGSLLGTACLIILPFQFIFFVLALVLISGIFVTQFLVDTK